MLTLMNNRIKTSFWCVPQLSAALNMLPGHILSSSGSSWVSFSWLVFQVISFVYMERSQISRMPCLVCGWPGFDVSVVGTRHPLF